MLRVVALVSSVLAACSGTVRVDRLKDVEDVVAACERYEAETATVIVDVPAMTEACDWDDPDSIHPKAGHFTARSEQVIPLDLPADAVICDMTLDMRGPDTEDPQDLIYDDQFFFTFDDVVLAASFGKAVEYMHSRGLLHFYDWQDIVGVQYAWVADWSSYCLGEDEGRADCTIPATQLKGPIYLDYDPDIVALLALEAVRQDRKDFGFVVVGDADDTDCQHDAFSFAVTVPYLLP